MNGLSQGLWHALLALAFVNGDLLAESEILKDNTAMVFPEQPDHPKKTQREGECNARFFLSGPSKVNDFRTI